MEKLIIRIYLLLCILLYPLIFFAKYFNYEFLEKIFVPLFVTLVFVFNIWLNPPKKGNNLFLFLAFICVCAGDFIINLTNWGGWFIVPFILVHISLIIYFSKEKKWMKRDAVLLIPILLINIVLIFLLKPFIGDASRLLLLTTYLLILSTMLWRAICFAESKAFITNKILIIGGAFLFFITDVCVASNILLNTKILVAITWICYVPALVMLSMMNYSFRSKFSN